ncbi:MAG: hypothetical protein PHS80_07655 [Methanothrix sp.]|nr:hypothetical protein [Methanothrix sp.]MDD4446285.1 hypothetical protein [Methanothrix sp.]
MNRIENPFETSEILYEKQLELLQTVKRRVPTVEIAKKRLDLQRYKLQIELDKMDEQAKNVVQSDRDDLAKMAMDGKKPLQVQISRLDENIRDLNNETQNVKEIEKQLEARIKAFKSEKEILKLRTDLLKELLESSNMPNEEKKGEIEMELSKIKEAVYHLNDELIGSNDLIFTELIKYGIQKDDAKPIEK